MKMQVLAGPVRKMIRRDLLIKGSRPLPAQRKFYKSKARFRAYIGGYGSGKTFAGCHEAIWLSYLNMGLTGMMLAPTYRMLEDATLTTFREILDKAGISYKYHQSSGVMRLPWGSKILFRSAEVPERLKGPNLAWVGVDEGALISKTAWEVAISRIRHPEAKRRSAFITTTPEGFNWLHEEFVEKNRKGYKVVYARTSENVHLPEDYVTDLEAAYAPMLVRQYLMGEFVNPAAGRVYHGFDRGRNVRDAVFDPARAVMLCVDFNVNPLHAAVVQDTGSALYVVDEIVLPSSNTYELCAEVRSRYGDVPVIAYPDPSGRARKTAGTTDAPSDFAILEKHGFEVRARPRTPAVKDRVNAVNRMLSGQDSQAALYVSDRCRETIRSFERTCYKPASAVVDKAAGAEHMADAVGYFIEYEYPVRAPLRVTYEGIGRRQSLRGY